MAALGGAVDIWLIARVGVNNYDMKGICMKGHAGPSCVKLGLAFYGVRALTLRFTFGASTRVNNKYFELVVLQGVVPKSSIDLAKTRAYKMQHRFYWQGVTYLSARVSISRQIRDGRGGCGLLLGSFNCLTEQRCTNIG